MRPAVVRALSWSLGLLPLVLALALWQVMGNPLDPSFPPPSLWLEAVGGMDEQHLVRPTVLKTVETFLAALVLSTVAGALLGMLIGASRQADRALGPLLDVCRILPPPAIVPIAVLLIGTTSVTTVAVVVFAAIWPILFNTAASMATIPPVRLEMSRTFALTRMERLRKIVVPSAMPGVALGVRVATPICLVVTLLAEMLASTGGVGQLLVERQRAYDAASVFGLLVLVGGLGLVVNVGVSAFERYLARHFLVSSPRP